VFTPSRLALARRRRGLTKKHLGELVGVSTRSITGYEAGEIEPTPLIVARLGDVLRFPPTFFEGDDLEEAVPDAASFRSMKKMTAAQRHAALSAGTLAYAFHDWLSERFRLPEPSIPKLGPSVDPEVAAEVVRTEWGLGQAPISNMVHLLEVHGARVFSLAEECREVDAFSLWRSGMAFVFLNTQKSGEHSRMDAAHELGHLVMHGHDETPQGREVEQEARAFASAFLMPRGRMRSAPRWPSLADLIRLKKPWKVSVGALNYRLHQLGVTTDWHHRTLWIEISKKGYRTKEPQPIQRETSQVLSKVFAALRKEGVSKTDIARALHLLPEELDGYVFHLAILPVAGNGSGSGRRSSSGHGLTVIKGGVG